MSPNKISHRVVSDRLDWITKMIVEIKSLPLDNYEFFIEDKRNVWSAESCLRRSIEALMDLGRHILAKRFGRGVSEYKEIALLLGESGVLSSDESTKMKILAGYRNRMVHYYHEITVRELFEICSLHLSDITTVANAIKKWINEHPDIVDETI
ncbi:DUF86 domain-containing protein [Thermodesulfobacteriota bacterium]